MDDLEFRRRLLADPYDTDPELQAAKAESERHQGYADDIAELDSKIDQALRVEVPEDLPDKILFSQTTDVEQGVKRPRWHLAIAASIAFVFGIALGQFNWGSATLDLNQTALAHYYHEHAFIEGINEGATIEQVNAKLQPFGKAFNALPGEVTYINHCSFGGQHALHMVMESDGQAYTVFVVPSASQAPAQKSDGKMQAVSRPVQSASVIVVGEAKSPAAPIAEQLQQQLTPQAI
ncbi:DUF3379 family protein [Salinivibrio sp. HTSP]|uniref:DUF3379 family protein n=1 Tax=Salinivibrio sp. HTSP TaxID=2115977 RepID=UPI000E30C4D6|nr:DUF3379 family protein [Salinivibrio sp. HTSP]